MSNLEQALAYLERGYSVIPLRCDLSKNPKEQIRPRLKEWKRYQRVLPTRAEVELWWAQAPNAGIAIICGAVSGLVVIDIDPRNGGDPDLSRWPETYTVKSPGGYHLYYKHPGADTPPSVGKIETGVDVRGDRSYIVAAGTVRADGAYEVHRDVELADLPELKAQKKPEKEDDFFSHDFSVGELNWAEDALVNGAPEGTRNDTLTRLAGLYAGKGVPEAVTLGQLFLWGKHACNPPLTQREVKDVVNRIYASEREAKKQEAFGKEPAIRLLRARDFINKYAGETSWLIDGWLPEGSIGFIVSPPECYKSWFTGELATSIATGVDFLGAVPVNKRGPVLVLQQEDSKTTTANRYSAQLSDKLFKWTEANGDDPYRFDAPGAEDLYITETRGFSFEDPAAVKELEAAIEALRPRLVIIDPLYQVVSHGDHMVAAPKQMQPLKKLRDKYGTTFLLVHHAGKSKVMDFDREGALGSQLLNAFVEFGFQVRKPDDTTVLIKRHAKDGPTPALVSLDWNIKLEDDEFVYRPTLVQLRPDEVEEIVSKYNSKRSGQKKDEGMELAELKTDGDISLVREALQNGLSTVGAICKESGLNQSRARTALQTLSQDGLVRRQNGEYTLA